MYGTVRRVSNPLGWMCESRASYIAVREDKTADSVKMTDNLQNAASTQSQAFFYSGPRLQHEGSSRLFASNQGQGTGRSGSLLSAWAEDTDEQTLLRELAVVVVVGGGGLSIESVRCGMSHHLQQPGPGTHRGLAPISASERSFAYHFRRREVPTPAGRKIWLPARWSETAGALLIGLGDGVPGSIFEQTWHEKCTAVVQSIQALRNVNPINLTRPTRDPQEPLPLCA